MNATLRERDERRLLAEGVVGRDELIARPAALERLELSSRQAERVIEEARAVSQSPPQSLPWRAWRSTSALR